MIIIYGTDIDRQTINVIRHGILDGSVFDPPVYLLCSFTYVVSIRDPVLSGSIVQSGDIHAIFNTKGCRSNREHNTRAAASPAVTENINGFQNQTPRRIF